MSEQSRRDSQVQRVIVVEGAANLSVLLAKLTVGLSTGSLAVIGDAIHSLTDVLNNIVALVVMRHSSAPADLQHPYGHRKFETLAVFGLASLLVVFAFELALQALRREETQIEAGSWELVLMLAVLGANVLLSAWQRSWAKKLNSDILLADASHTFVDVLTTVVVILGWQLSAMGYVWLDKACALGVSALVLYLAFNLFRRAVPILVDESALDPVSLIQAAETVAGVSSVSRVRSRWIGSESAVDMIVVVDAKLPIQKAHDIADQIEAVLESRFGVQDVTIHIEPSEIEHSGQEV